MNLSNLKISWTVGEVDQASREVVEEAYSHGVDEIGSSDRYSYIRQVKNQLGIPEDEKKFDQWIDTCLYVWFYRLESTNTAEV